MRPLALITGASAGLGREFAVQLAARGHDLILVARDEPRLAAVAAELATGHGAGTEVLRADLTRDEDVDRVVVRIHELPRLDLLVNNAGFGTRGSLVEADPVQQEAMIRVHALAPLRLIQAALPSMMARRAGAIVNVASIAAFIASPRNANYCATKAYIVTLTEALAAELRGTGVQAQALCPGFTHTEFHARMQSNKDAIPPFMWLDAARVVATSLEALAAGGPVVTVPGSGYRLLIPLLRLLPRGWVNRVTGAVRR